MTKTSIVFAAALSLAAFGCKKKGGDCTKAIANGMEISSKGSMAGMDKTMMAKLRDLGIKNCQDDKWSDEAISCMTSAKSETEAQGCYSKLTADQQTKMNKSAMELASPAAGSGTAAAAAGSADSAGSAGSAAGSDTAGSAAMPK
jgi:uncharacterized lipoprotein NlpE involved in copper resistance